MSVKVEIDDPNEFYAWLENREPGKWDPSCAAAFMKYVEDYMNDPLTSINKEELEEYEIFDSILDMVRSDWVYDGNSFDKEQCKHALDDGAMRLLDESGAFNNDINENESDFMEVLVDSCDIRDMLNLIEETLKITIIPADNDRYIVNRSNYLRAMLGRTF